LFVGAGGGFPPTVTSLSLSISLSLLSSLPSQSLSQKHAS